MLGQTGLPRTLTDFLPRCRNRPWDIVVARLPTIITRRVAAVHQRAQEIDHGAIAHAARDQFAREITQRVRGAAALPISSTSPPQFVGS